jgi:hypothetical protein
VYVFDSPLGTSIAVDIYAPTVAEMFVHLVHAIELSRNDWGTLMCFYPNALCECSPVPECLDVLQPFARFNHRKKIYAFERAVNDGVEE